MSRKPVDREGPIHRACLQFLRKVLPGALIHHSPNEMPVAGASPKSKAIAQNKAKGLGMQPGWPDLEVFYRGLPMMFEVKAEGGTMSKTQRAMRDAFEAQGVHYAVVRSVDDVKEALDDWGIEFRGRIS